jgi:hypothetical protein
MLPGGERPSLDVYMFDPNERLAFMPKAPVSIFASC